MTQLTPIRGFTNTPVTKSICVLSTFLALGLLVLQLKHYVKLSIDPFIVDYSQYWRIFTFQTTVINESDFLLCIILWFHFKNLERFFGPKKYLSLIALFALYNGAVTFLLLSLGQLLLSTLMALGRTIIQHQDFSFVYTDTFFNSVIPGPLGILSSLYVCYGTYVPISYHFTLVFRKPGTSPAAKKQATLTLNDHFQIQILYTLLIFNNGIALLLPCLVGLAIGRLYTIDLLAGSKSCSLPDLVFSLFVNPRNVRVSPLSSLRRRLRGYQPLSLQHEAQEDDIREPTPQNEDDQEEPVDEIRANENNQRSETPVRPLGRQFLDTFRT